MAPVRRRVRVAREKQRGRGEEAREEEEEEEEGLFKGDAVNEEDPERDRAEEEEARPRQRARLFACLSIPGPACDLVRIRMKLLSELRGGLRARTR